MAVHISFSSRHGSTVAKFHISSETWKYSTSSIIEYGEAIARNAMVLFCLCV